MRSRLGAVNTEDFTEKNIYQFDARKQYEREQVTQKEILKQKLNDYTYVEQLIDDVFLNPKSIHFLNHYGIKSYNIQCGPFSLNKSIEKIPYKNNYACHKCDQIVTDLNKYEMIYNFLKKKIGPDCSRLVTFRTLNLDKDETAKTPLETKKYEIESYFLYDDKMNNLRKIYSSCEQVFNISVTMTDKEGKMIYFHF
jgi:hypothetical protein